MSLALQSKAQTFLDRPVPESAEFVPDFAAEAILTHYAATGRPKLAAKQIELCTFEALEAAAAARNRNPDEADYFRECAELLRAIRDELAGDETQFN